MSGDTRPRILLVISARPTASLAADVAAGRQPQRDYQALSRTLDADLLFADDAVASRTGRLVARLLGGRAALTWEAFRRRSAYDAIFTDTEMIGLPFALLLKMSLSRSGRPRHVMLGHYLSPVKKRIFFRLGAASHIDLLIVHGAAQREFAITQLKVPSQRVAKLPYFADTTFWRPDPDTDRAASNDDGDSSDLPLICATGMERRDYATLISAVDGENVRLRLTATNAQALQMSAAASSLASPGAFDLLPANVHVEPCADYLQLRALYQRARFIVVPLQDVDFPAGITVILEAMAMGKAVIVTGSRGQTDVVRDPCNDGRGVGDRAWWPGFLAESEYAETLGKLPTGLYVPPGDAVALRKAITCLLEDPRLAEELGHNGRQVVTAYFTLDAFAQRFASAIWPKFTAR